MHDVIRGLNALIQDRWAGRRNCRRMKKQTARIKTGENETVSKGHVWKKNTQTYGFVKSIIFPSPFWMEKK